MALREIAAIQHIIEVPNLSSQSGLFGIGSRAHGQRWEEER
jgi:hypothetical protein